MEHETPHESHDHAHGHETSQESFLSKINTPALLAELIAVFALVFIGSLAIANFGPQGATLTTIALAHGLTIAVMVAATAHISGAHINPAVTISLWVTKKIDNLDTITYILAQLVGGILGALAARFALGGTVPTVSTTIGNVETLIVEAILTFFLVFVIFGTAVDGRFGGSKVAALAIGLTVALDIMAGGPLTGAAMNPARYMGPAVVAGDFTNIALYWAGPALGGMLAAIVYTKFLSKDN